MNRLVLPLACQNNIHLTLVGVLITNNDVNVVCVSTTDSGFVAILLEISEHTFGPQWRGIHNYQNEAIGN